VREEIVRFADVAGYRAFMSGRTTTRGSPRRTADLGVYLSNRIQSRIGAVRIALESVNPYC
jgi:hypothetical protein